jgi:hypothetical protein
MSQRYLTRAEYNAIVAGLRCLQQVREQCGGDLPPDLQDILVNECGDEDLDDLDIDMLCEDLDTRNVQLTVEGDFDDFD